MDRTTAAVTTNYPRLLSKFTYNTTCTSYYTPINVSEIYDIPRNTEHYTSSTLGYDQIYLRTGATGPAAVSLFSSCQPRGYDKSNFSFSPGICPEQWTYYNLGTTGGTTTARCCPSGYHTHTRYDLKTHTLYCLSSATTSTTVYLRPTPSVNGNETEVTGRPVYALEAWWVAWQPSDTNSLEIMVPQMTYQNSVPSWVPGDRIDVDRYNTGSDSAHAYDGLIAIAAAVPSVAFVLILACCGCCCYKSKKAKREKSGYIGDAKFEFAEQSVPGAIELGDMKGRKKKLEVKWA